MSSVNNSGPFLGRPRRGPNQANAITQADGTIGKGSANLVSADQFWIVTITKAINPGLGLQVFSFVVGVIAEAIQEGKAIACYRDGNHCTKFKVAACFGTHDWPNMSLSEADDAIRDTFTA